VRTIQENRSVRAGTNEKPPAPTPAQVAGLEELYRERFVATSRLAYLLTGDRDAADELAQEAFARLHRHVATVENPPAFLRTALVNLCHDHRRRRDTARRYPQRPHPPQAPPDLPHTLGDTWTAIQALPERRRDAVVLRYYADLSTDEIARLLDVRPATVRSLLHRGLASLKEVLSDDR
jgi:RNA polymerase sigma factor (sigma-70 family)